MPLVVFWVGFALCAAVVGFAAFRLLALGLNAPMFTAALGKMLRARDHDRFQKLTRAARGVPAAELARRAFELREQALTQGPGADFVVGYRDTAPTADFERSLRTLVAPDLALQKRRFRLSLVLSLAGLLAPLWYWFTQPPMTAPYAPLGATVLLVLLSIHTAVRSLTLARGLDGVLDGLVPLLDSRKW